MCPWLVCVMGRRTVNLVKMSCSAVSVRTEFYKDVIISHERLHFLTLLLNQ